MDGSPRGGRIANVLETARKPALIVTLAVGTLLGAVHALGLDARVDGWLYDAAHVLAPDASGPAAQVLLVEYAPAEAVQIDDAELGEALLALKRLGAVQLVVEPIAGRVPRISAEVRAQLGPLVLGVPPEFQPAPGTDDGVPRGSMAALVLALNRDGIVRRLDGSATLEAVAAGQRLGAGVPVPAQYRPNFTAGPGHIPRVEWARLRAGGLIPELVAGRSVIIAPRPDLQALLMTPLAARGSQVSPAELRAWALDTLIQQQPVRELPTVAAWLLLLATSAACALGFALVRGRRAWISVGAIALLLGLLAWSLLHYAAFWIPLATLWLALFGTYASVRAFQARQQETAVRRLLIDATARLRQTSLPVSFFGRSDPWKPVITLINQVLELERMIFLERIPGDHRSREVAAHNCTLADIEERRRDYERAPYTDAIAASGPIEPQRTFFVGEDRARERVIIVPLEYAGYVLGFWCFGVLSARMDARPDFLAIVRDLAVQLGELLYHRRNFLEQRDRDRKPLQRLLRLDSLKNVAGELQKALGATFRRQLIVESASNGTRTGTALYDLFGNLLQVNEAMQEASRQRGLRVFDLTALDLLTALSGLDASAARGVLLETLRENRGFTLPVRGPDESAGASLAMLQVRPLAVPQSRQNLAASSLATPFELLGFQFELSDLSEVQSLLRRNDVLVGRLKRRLRDDLAAIERIAAGSPGDEVLRRARAAIQVVDLAWRQLSSDPFRAGTLHAVEVPAALARALEAVRPALAEARLTANLDHSASSALALSHEPRLVGVLLRLLQLLAGNAASGATLSLRVADRRDTGHVEVTLEAPGGGLDPTRLQRWITDAPAAVSAEANGNGAGQDPFVALSAARTELAALDARFEVSTVLGQGLRLTVNLPGIGWTAAASPPAAR